MSEQKKKCTDDQKRTHPAALRTVHYWIPFVFASSHCSGAIHDFFEKIPRNFYSGPWKLSRVRERTELGSAKPERPDQQGWAALKYRWVAMTA